MNRLRRLILTLSWLSGFSASAEPYFHQQIIYRIRVTLDDQRHFLRGSIAVDYTNRSDSSLQAIYFHLWPNAYRGDRSGLAKELYADQNPILALKRPEGQGFLDSLDFRCDGQVVAWSSVDDQEDIVRLTLPYPLKPGDQVVITTPFRVKIPDADISRLGHAEGRYYLTQWYPKPAVFDRNGWNTMTYQNWGEFYSEFARYEVELTLPEKYWVATTGNLRDEEEQRRRSLADSVTRAGGSVSDAMLRPAATAGGMTLHFEADSVHDFALFAAPDFQVLCDRSSGKPSIWSFYLREHEARWKSAAGYLRQALDSLSHWIGPYPYTQFTAVDVDQIAGRDMEYPGIIALGIADADEFRKTIFHEAAHQWFYGMLGTNERRYPWMDEGWTNFFEYRLNQQAQRGVDHARGSFLTRWLRMSDDPENYLPYLRFSYLKDASAGQDALSGMPALYYSKHDYICEAYVTSALGVAWLNESLGQSVFDKALQTYYQEWAFRHPQPEDLRAVFERVSGKSLGWYFEDWTTNRLKVDFKLSGRINSQGIARLTVAHKGGIAGPVTLAAFRGGKMLEQRQIQAGEYDRAFDWTVPGAERFQLDPEGQVPEVNRRNNEIRTRGLLRRIEPIRVQCFLGHEVERHTTLGIFPAMGWNTNNGLLIGGGIHNLNFEEKPFEILAMPLFGLEDRELNFGGFLRYHFYPKTGNLRRVRFQTGWSRYAYATDSYQDTSGRVLAAGPLHYLRADHSVQLSFQRGSRQRVQSQLRFHVIQIRKELPYFFNYAPAIRNDLFVTSAYERTTAFPDAQHLLLEAQWHRDMYKITLTDERLLPYRNPRKGLRLRFFGGYVHINNTSVAGQDFRLRLGGFEGSDDYLFRDVFPGRNNPNGLFSQQFVLTEGGFTAPVSYFGKSTGWMLTARASTTLPGKLPFRLYLAAGSFKDINDFRPEFGKVSFEGGVELPILSDIFVIYLPVVYSNDIRDALDRLDLSTAERIRFELRLRELNPIELARKHLR